MYAGKYVILQTNQLTMRKTFYFFLTAFVSFSFQVQGQIKDSTFEGSLTDDTRAVATYSLQDCIKFALENSESIKKAKHQVAIAEAEVAERLAVGLPRVSIETNIVNNLRIPRVFLPDGTLFGMPPGPAAVTFQTQYSGSATIEANQMIFDFSYLLGVRAAKAYTELTKKQVNLNKIDIAERVMKAYYAVLINQERINLANLNIFRLDTLLKDARTLNANGLLEKIDVMRAEVALNNMRTEGEKMNRLQELTLQLLKFQMGMPVRDSLSLQGNLRELTLNLEENMNAVLDVTQRHEFLILQNNKNLQEINARYIKSMYYPRFYAFGSIGANTGQNQFNDVWKFNDRWFRNASVGLSMQWNIFDGFKRRHSLEKNRLEILKIKEDEKILRKSVDFEIEKAKVSLQSNLKDLEIQQRNMRMAQEVVNLMKVKFKNGTSTSSDIINAEAAYKEAENNYYNALYNAVLTKIDLQKALGKLPVGE